MITDNKLLDLDFRPGIHDDDIDFNFGVVKGWIDRCRLRLGGWGLVEGFVFSKDLPKFDVLISDGVLINQKGEEVAVPPHREHVGEPNCQAFSETIKVDDNGLITMKYAPYSKKLKACAWYVPPEHLNRPDPDELVITLVDENRQIPYLNIFKNIVKVNPESYRGMTVKVDYLYSNDRIDAVFIKKDGSEYAFQKGIISTSPSSPELSQYDADYYLVGFCHWHVSEVVDVTFSSWGRLMTRVYVDDQNRLWIDGELYKKGKYIYFIKPDPPSVEDIYCDEDNNLFVYREKNGVLGWWPLNDKTNASSRGVYIYGPDDNPDDLQTFIFPESENMTFMPDEDELDIYIDNTPMMKDQFTEIIQRGKHPYEDKGIGFKLIEPLDEKRTVQVIINHTFKSNVRRDTFQRMAIFSFVNYQPFTTDNTKKIFYTDYDYEAGEKQLEVYVDGKRLLPEHEFIEQIGTNDYTEADKGKLSRIFRVNVPLTAGQVVSYRVIRHMWSYENLQKIVDTIENNSDKALQLSTEISTKIETFEDAVRKQLKSFEERLDGIILPNLENYWKKTDVIDEAHVGARTFRKSFYFLSAADAMIHVPNTTTEDYINPAYVDNGVLKPLFNGTDYSITDNAGETYIILNSAHVSSDPTKQVYVTGIHFERGNG